LPVHASRIAKLSPARTLRLCNVRFIGISGHKIISSGLPKESFQSIIDPTSRRNLSIDVA